MVPRDHHYILDAERISRWDVGDFLDLSFSGESEQACIIIGGGDPTIP